MTIKFFLDANGVYLGEFSDGAVPPDGAIEIPTRRPNGNAIWNGTSWDEPVERVVDVTPRQARLALLGAGLLQSVETYLSAPGNEAAKITWEYALEIRRDDPLIASVGTALNMTAQQIDDLFATAKTL